jgi:uncharacterized damage-inducible protein DinB
MVGPRQQHFRHFALYNRWANQQLYRSAERCSLVELTNDRGAFFSSILGTLNHLLVTDRMWRKRLEGNSPSGVKLDEVLFADLPSLAEARRDEDRALIATVYVYSEEELGATMAYATSSGASQTQPLHEVLAHLFNHQTHHRGQAHDLLGQALGKDRTPVLDLLYYQRTAAVNDAP